MVCLDFVICNPGQCKFFPLVSPRHSSCYEEEECRIDHDCHDYQKCCENPCGILKCYDMDVDPLEKIGKLKVSRITLEQRLRTLA